MAYNEMKLRFGINLDIKPKKVARPKDSKIVTGLVIRVDGIDRVGIRLTGDPIYADYLCLPFEEESLNTIGKDKVFVTDKNNRNTLVYKAEDRSKPQPYKVYGYHHLIEGTIRTLSDGSRVFHFIEDLGLLKRDEDAPINNLK